MTYNEPITRLSTASHLFIGSYEKTIAVSKTILLYPMVSKEKQQP